MEGVRKKTSWGGSCGKRQRWTGDGCDGHGDSGSDDGEEEEEINSKKLYIKVREALPRTNVPGQCLRTRALIPSGG